MTRRQIPKRDQMTATANRIAALSKIATAPLHTLTDTMIESIARSHKGNRPGGYEKLLAELDGHLMERKAREGFGG